MSTCPNGAPPMVLAWRNYTVSQDGKAVNRGIQIEVGSPPQIFALRPSVGDDDLFLINQVNCAPTYNDSCIGTAGGIFNSTASTSYAIVSEDRWNGTNDYVGTDLALIYFNDVLQFGKNGTIIGYPLLMDQAYDGVQGGLPLAFSSTFLQLAVEAGAAPSKIWGLWTGSRSIDNPADGALVLGGYDESRLNGTPTKFGVINPKCPTCVTITELTYESPTGPISLLANSSDSLRVALEPFERSLNVPQYIFDNFIKASNGTWDQKLEEITYPASKPPTGNLSVTLDNGYQTIIPAEEIFVYPRLIDDNGIYSITNNTFFIADVLNQTEPGYVADWGIPYLTMNYLVADWTRSQFSLTPAVRGQRSVDAASLQVVCDVFDNITTTSAPSSNPTATTQVTTSTSAAPVHHKNNTGAIAGGVVGGIAVLLLVIGIIVFVTIGRRRRAKAASAEAARSNQVQPETTQRGAPQDRMSQYTGYTATSPTDYKELDTGSKDASAVSKWPSAKVEEQLVSPALSTPIEMPAHHYDDLESHGTGAQVNELHGNEPHGHT